MGLQLSTMFASEPVPKYFLEGGRWYWWWDDELWVWEEVRVFAVLLFFCLCFFFGCRSGKSMQAGKNGSGRPGGHMTSSANGAVVKTFGKTVGAVGRSGLGGAVGAGGCDECLITVMLYLVHRTSSRQSCSPGGGPWITHQIQATGWLHVRATFFLYIFFFVGWLFEQCSGEAWERSWNRSQMRTALASKVSAYVNVVVVVFCLL